jgi:alpha-amylase
MIQMIIQTITPEEPEVPGELNLADYNNGTGVMMQAFYWDVEPRHEWWTTINDKIEVWAECRY